MKMNEEKEKSGAQKLTDYIVRRFADMDKSIDGYVLFDALKEIVREHVTYKDIDHRLWDQVSDNNRKILDNTAREEILDHCRFMNPADLDIKIKNEFLIDCNGGKYKVRRYSNTVLFIKELK